VGSDPRPWYRRAFGRRYPLVYPHRDDADAQRAVDLVAPLLPRGTILDLACGEGRHMRALGRAGLAVVGLDISFDLLSLAQAKDPRAHLVVGDMRALPFRSGRFAAVLSLFTSFGYFESDEEDRRVLVEAARVLAPGGSLVLDLANPAVARASAGGPTERRSGPLRIEETRRLVEDGRRLAKHVVMRDAGVPGAPIVDEYTENLRLYEREEIEGALRGLGFRSVGAWGDYGGEPPRAEAPRMILAFAKGPRAAGGVAERR
jgi:SAM-dependent methyltransferase